MNVAAAGSGIPRMFLPLLNAPGLTPTGIRNITDMPQRAQPRQLVTSHGSRENGGSCERNGSWMTCMAKVTKRWQPKRMWAREFLSGGEQPSTPLARWAWQRSRPAGRAAPTRQQLARTPEKAGPGSNERSAKAKVEDRARLAQQDRAGTPVRKARQAPRERPATSRSPSELGKDSTFRQGATGAQRPNANLERSRSEAAFSGLPHYRVAA